jgi:hypothetical protein
MGIVKVTLEGGEYKVERIPPERFQEAAVALDKLHSNIDLK